MRINSPFVFLFWMLPLSVSLTQRADAATYYVATTGNDTTGNGSVSAPWRTPQKCASTVVAGDTCLIGDGTYTDTNGDGTVINLNGANGTADRPITIRSLNPFRAVLIVPGLAGYGNAGVAVSRSNYIIEDFEITGGTATSSINGTSNIGVIFWGGDRTTVRHNKIHHIARTLCYNNAYGNAGIFTDLYTSNPILENNLIYSIGRLRDGENGCSTTIYQHDHGIYIAGTDSPTIRNNIIYDSNRGYPVTIYSSSRASSNVKIYNNTFSDKSPNVGTKANLPVGQINLSGTINTADVRNNICHDPSYGCISYGYLTASNIMVDNNMSSIALNATSVPSGVTVTANNIQNTNAGFTDVGKRDYSLTASSKAIDVGYTLSTVTKDYVGMPRPQGAAYDVGAYERSTNSNAPSPPRNLTVQ